VTAEQIVVLVLIVAAFAAGWVARGGPGEAAREDDADTPKRRRRRRRPPPDDTVPAAPGRRTRAAPTPRADPVADTARALALAAAAYETAVDRWLDERDAITPAGRAAVGEVERAAQRLDAATARLDELDHPLADAAWDALDALRDAARHLDAFRNGAALDAATSRALDRIEDDLADARRVFESGAG
jgi:hypothetical protein